MLQKQKCYTEPNDYQHSLSMAGCIEFCIQNLCHPQSLHVWLSEIPSQLWCIHGRTKGTNEYSRKYVEICIRICMEARWNKLSSTLHINLSHKDIFHFEKPCGDITVLLSTCDPAFHEWIKSIFLLQVEENFILRKSIIRKEVCVWN